MDFEKHPQWQALITIDNKLRGQGFQSLLAGGAVRDLLLGRLPNDMDLATNATPEQVSALFDRVVMVGEAFGVCRVVLDEQVIEVATFRKDGPYKDGRKPESVEFSDAQQDAQRRDFTINALFYDLKSKQIIDYVGGQADVMKQTIRTVGDPKKRFEEDKLRVLRALRFHSQLGFTVEKNTLAGIKLNKNHLDQVSMERLRDEWHKLLKGSYCLSAIDLAHKTGVWQRLFVDWPYKVTEYGKLKTNSDITDDRLWILWFMLHFEKRSALLNRSLSRWKLPKKLTQKIEYCIDQRSWFETSSQWDAIDLAMILDEPIGQDAFFSYKTLKNNRLDKAMVSKISQAKSYFVDGDLPAALVSGKDLIQFGFPPGPKMAERLKKAYRIQLETGAKDKESIIRQLI